MSHYIPDRQRTPLVYWARALYLLLIPATIGGMLLFVVTDYRPPPHRPPARERGEGRGLTERVYTRFLPGQRVQHGLLIAAFTDPGRDRPVPDLRGHRRSASG